MDEIENQNPQIPWKPWLISTLILFGYLLFCPAAGLCRFYWPPSDRIAMLLMRNAVNFVIYWAAVHLVLVFPLHTMGMKQVELWPAKWKRLLVMTVLVSGPLGAYGYYRGGVNNWIEFQQLALMVVPAALIGALGYDRSRSAPYFSLFLAIGTFIPFFLVSDIMGNLPTLIHYASNTPNFYPWLVVFPVVALGFAWFRMGRTA